MITFLELNEYVLNCTAEEACERTLQAASSELSEADWTRWVEATARPR